MVKVRSTADPALESAMSSKIASPRSSNPTVVVPTTLVSAVELVTVTSHLGMMTVLLLYPLAKAKHRHIVVHILQIRFIRSLFISDRKKIKS